jgi:hypothetical protein
MGALPTEAPPTPEREESRSPARADENNAEFGVNCGFLITSVGSPERRS